MGRRELALLVGSSVFAMLLLEGLARAWIALRWPADRIERMTADGPERGRFLLTSPFGYSLRPSYRSEDGAVTHNSLGFRNGEFPRKKPLHQLRIALLGASTVYGLHVADRETGAVVLQESLQTMFPSSDILVINAGVPGWVSTDTVLNLEERVLPLSPDMIVVMDGRNEVGPQTFAGLRPDYSHYATRDPARIAAVQSEQRRLFRASHLATLVAHRAPDLFGYRHELFFPVYARIEWQNQPSAEQVLTFAADPSRFEVFRSNLVRVISLAREQGAIPVLATVYFDPARYESDLLPKASDAVAAERGVVLRNLEITREVARKESVLLFDGAALAKPELMNDDCHPNAKGERIFGRALAEAIAPALRERTATAAAGTEDAR